MGVEWRIWKIYNFDFFIYFVENFFWDVDEFLEIFYGWILFDCFVVKIFFVLVECCEIFSLFFFFWGFGGVMNVLMSFWFDDECILFNDFVLVLWKK